MSDISSPSAKRPRPPEGDAPSDPRPVAADSGNGSKHRKPSRPESKDDPERRKGLFPPKLQWWKKLILGFGYVVVLLASLYLVDQICVKKALPPCICLTYIYIAFALVLATIIMDRVIRYPLHVHEARLEDVSEVESLIVEACTVEPRLEEPKKPDDYEGKIVDLEDEVKRLTELGPTGWTEYQVLSLNQLLVEFLKPDELRAHAQSSLEDLQEYADDRFDEKHYEEWKHRIKNAIDKIDKDDDAGRVERDEAAEMLRGDLRTLLEHVADYDRYWAEGSAMVRALMTSAVVAVPLLLAMGLLPILHPAGDNVLRVFNWALLGASGALTAVLLTLRSNEDLAEVGNTKGRRELWRAILGGVLGVVAGVLLYSMIAGGILSGAAFPEITSEQPALKDALRVIFSGMGLKQPELVDTARAVFWGITSGFSFEWVFDRMRSATQATSQG